MTDLLLRYPVIAFYVAFLAFVGATGWCGYLIWQTVQAHRDFSNRR